MQSLLDQGAVVTVRLQDRAGGGQNYLVSIYGSKFIAEDCLGVEQLLCLPEKVGDRAAGSSLFDVLAWTAFGTEVSMQRGLDELYLVRVTDPSRCFRLDANEETLERALDHAARSISARVRVTGDDVGVRATASTQGTTRIPAIVVSGKGTGIVLE